jgi:hypothetical protein
MGSFATSLHVKANDAAAVADALRRLLLDEGYETTEEEPERGFPMGIPSAVRAIHLSTAREGWVSLLDSEGIGAPDLAAALSGQLQTHAIQFFVNDSDSWHYQLFHAGQAIDEFDSCPDDEDFDEDDDGPVLLNMGGGINAADAQRVIQERALEWQQQLLQKMPPHLREMQKRWMTTGQIVPEEMQEVNNWMRGQMPTMLEQLRELMGAGSKKAPSQAEPPTSNGRLQGHLEHLRPLLKADVKDARVLEVLNAKATFAEHTLGDFMPLIGITPFYANLSYPYLAEYTSADLARQSIQLAEHLKFKRSSGRGAGHWPRVH